MRTFAGFILVVLGFVLAFWGGFCLLGGPDAKFLSPGSFIYGGVFIFTAGSLIAVGRRFAEVGP